jgi:hypothetical protein
VHSRSQAHFALATVMAGAIAAACGTSSSDSSDAGSGSTSSCMVSPSCPADVPSYKTDIVPILQNACTPCHSPDGSAGFSETTYALVYPQRASMLSQVALCAMPPLNGPVMSDAQRVELTAWLECNAPDN